MISLVDCERESLLDCGGKLFLDCEGKSLLACGCNLHLIRGRRARSSLFIS